MNQYQELAAQLLKYELDPQQDQVCLSLYQPNKNYSKQQIFQQTKSLFLKALREDDELKHINNQAQLLDSIREKIMNLETLLNGIAAFMRLSFNGSKAKLINELYLVPLGEKPVRDYFTGPRFDVDQLFMAANSAANALVVDLKRKECFIYAYFKGQFEQIDILVNEHIEEEADEYLQKFTPLKWGEGVIHSTGSDKFDRRMLKQNELFLQDVIKKIKDYPYSYKHLLYFYTNSFAPFIGSYLEELDDDLPDSDLVMVEKNIKKRELFKKEAQKVLTEYINQKKLQIIEELEDDYYAVVENWKAIAEAVRNGQVRKLIIRPNLSLQGYVTDDGLVYINQPEIEAKQVDNLIPWLVAAVTQQKGEVIVFAEDEFKGRPHKLAQLRYKLNKQEKIHAA